MNKKILYLALILGVVMIAISLFTQPPITQLNEGKFVSTSTDKNTYEPNDQIRITWTYKNTWSESHRFLIEGELNGGQDTEAIKTISSGSTVTDSFTFTAPTTAGTYKIDLDGSVEMVDGRWTSGDGSASVTITVEEPTPEPEPTPEDDPNADDPTIEDPYIPPQEDIVTEETGETSTNPTLTVNSNIEGVNVAYEYESKTIDSSLTTTFDSIPTGQTFQFVATKDGYQTKIFNVYLQSNNVIVTLDMNEAQENLIQTVEESELNEVTVIVLNDDNIPISECRVFIGSEGKQTSPDGQVVFNLPDGTYLVSLTHENYLSFTQEYEINQDTKMTITLGDKSDFTGIPSINVNMESVKDYQIYLLISGIILVILASGLIIYNRKKVMNNGKQ